MNTQAQTTNENETAVYLDSRLVAELAGKEHKILMRDIRQYNDFLKGTDLYLNDFWVEDTYKAQNGKTQPCYQITKKGCEFIQHKMTGQKGAIFTAKYINAFHDMGERQAQLHQPQQPTDDLGYLKSKMIDLYNSASTLEELHEGLHQINNVLIALHNARVTLVAKD
ncbi:antirepressor protein [Streptococcus satellite phage Javan418]|nr:antirepressor protein [Streptococcus satellite phage Javan418]